MPLLKRVVSPVHVSRVPLVEEWVTDENGRVYAALLPATFQPQDLEAFTNLTLANLITQLSSLSRHAEDLFGEMIAESTAILNRTVSLQGRVDKLSVKVKNLDSNVEEVSLQDIHMRKAFKSSTLFDQQVVSRDTIPAPMLETYQTCEQPPPLHQLNPYRDDGKDGLKFYTDPSYFFNLWREEMTQETERLKHDKKQKESMYGTNSHAYSPTHETNQAAPPSEHPEYPPPYQDQYSDYPPPPYTPDGAVSQGSTPSRSGPRALAGRPMQPPPDPPSNSNTPTPPGGSHSGTPTRLRGPSQGREFLPPPPPPPADRQQQPPMENMTGGVATMSPGPGRHAQPAFNHEPDLPPPPPTPDKSGEPEPPPPSPPPPPPVAPIQPVGQMVGASPPPSPPPLVPNGNAPGAPPPPPMPPLIIGSQTVLNKPRKVEKKVLPPIEVNGRSELLKAIREGIQLRPRVDDVKTKPKEDPDSIDVASILQRRFAFEVSDSESSSDSESDSDQWDETSA
ncbi:wiskott-Aldrich syndrome protein family member 2-like isoform X6 [Portunus trituberculatus]|uniref:wiskott-Aldrich syndrome protein family member 2-like isoform X6 n=1 Tax=Portunus trituberculatus TaxID=210409 RepID=UPI001E1CB835|nr:wiskott-Aldrich syndrome protein family member 2-like isoform X6 [Portunus trituberculatus]